MADVYKQSFKQNYTNNIELSIFNCGIERCAPSKTWGPGIRDHYLIHLVLSGKGEFEVGGRTWQVSTGDLFFARPSQLIRYTADEVQPWEYSWVGFNGACAHKLAAQLPFTDDAPVHHTSDPDGMRAALANIYSSRGLQPLLKHDGLMVAAAARARELSQRYSHTRPDGSECFTILWHLGIDYGYAGENIAMGQRPPEIVMNDWMNSSGHRANILNENYDCIGVGYTMVDGYPYWVQLFTGDFDL